MAMADENQIIDAMGELQIEEDDPESVEPPLPACENNPEDGEFSAETLNNFIVEYEERGLQQPTDYATSAALQELENNPTGPLTAVQLREFLRHRFDKTRRQTTNVLRRYTEDVTGARNQINKLGIRIKEIKDKQDQRRNLVLNWIQTLMGDLKKRKETQLNTTTGIELPMGLVCSEAFRYMSNRGPLNEEGLRNFINTGKYWHLGFSQQQLVQLGHQLHHLKYRILDNNDIEQHNLNFTMKKIQDAIKHLDKENAPF